ncbi:MAG: hypothetical protein K0R18_2638 [Bacillales bacterium]|jgi:hypothetical protein|nr:hypothetical protein [Bacillales bacterium]
MERVKSIFKEVEPSYLIKSYIIAAIIFFVFKSANLGIGPTIYTFICALLFPFSAIVWDSFAGLMMGNNMLILPIPVVLIWKFIKFLVLFMFAVFIAPIGVLYLAIRANSHQ